MLFESLTPAIVRKSINELRERIFDDRQKEFDTLEDYYAGGDNIKQYLTWHTKEEYDEYQERKNHITYPNYFARLADQLIDGVYGDAVVRGLDEEASDDERAELDAVWAANNMISLQRRVGYGMVVLGMGWANVVYREQNDTVRVFPVHPANVWYATDPDDPADIVELVERRIDYTRPSRDLSNPVFRYWIWTKDESIEVSEDFAVLTPAARNEYKRVPYVFWPGRQVLGDMGTLSYVRDQMTQQRELMNLISERDLLIRYQTHGVLVLSGTDEPKIETGPKRFLRVPSDGDAKFINPGADLMAVESALESSISRMFESGGVPMSLVRGGSANSGLQLAIEMRPFTRIVEALRADAMESEKDLVRIVCKVGAVHGLNLPEEVDPRVEFLDNVLPSDKDGEFLRDLQMVNNMPPLLSRADFLIRWHPQINNQEEAEAYLEQIGQEEAARPRPQTGGGGLFGDLFAAPEPEEEAQA